MEASMPQRAILLHPDDNVATALTDLRVGEGVTITLEDVTHTVTLRGDIAFGHKFALAPIPEGAPILKYGLPIGNALEAIEPGAWVHVHNCRSERFGFRREKYGLRA
jgi:altronate dehydratase small subunit